MKIVHLHGFKCAGSTFSWILQRMYGNKLLYVESKSGNERLSWDNVNSSLNMSEYLGITSHTWSIPISMMTTTFLWNLLEIRLIELNRHIFFKESRAIYLQMFHSCNIAHPQLALLVRIS